MARTKVEDLSVYEELRTDSVRSVTGGWGLGYTIGALQKMRRRQVYAGARWGAPNIMRVGQEVPYNFLNGKSIYQRENPSPYPLGR